MSNITSIVGICVTYNPCLSDFKRNIHKNLNFLERLYIVDNSDEKSIQNQLKALCSKYLKCHIITLGSNMGIAYALNVGCQTAITDGWKWVLTLDQDSQLSDNLVPAYKNYLNGQTIQDVSKIGILTCNMSTWQSNKSATTERVNLCWTSGALMNLNAYSSVGGFDNDLFIDGVDFDMCAKMILSGYEILRINSVSLTHNLGKTKDYEIFGHHLFYVTNHNALRRYYMTRNSLLLNKKYGKSFKPLRHTIISIPKVILKIILFEDNKILKMKAILNGMRDYRKGIFGKSRKTY